MTDTPETFVFVDLAGRPWKVAPFSTWSREEGAALDLPAVKVTVPWIWRWDSAADQWRPLRPLEEPDPIFDGEAAKQVRFMPEAHAALWDAVSGRFKK